MSDLTPASITALLSLQPHPEGGFFAETFRDSPPNPNSSADSSQSRPISTLIYYLLTSPDFSSLHRLDAAEGWHYYGGNAALEVVELDEGGPKVTRLGMRLAEGERPQCVVRKGRWFGARVAEEQLDGDGDGKGERWALLGCTVAPGFLFEKFEMGKREKLVREFPGCAGVIRELTRSEHRAMQGAEQAAWLVKGVIRLDELDYMLYCSMPHGSRYEYTVVSIEID